MKKIFSVAVGDPPTLAAFLQARGLVVDVASGGVHVDGKRVLDGDFALAPGMRLVVRADARAQLEPRIVFEDDWILVVDKPSGMASQASRGDVAASTEAWAQRRDPRARLVHRLDRDASGLMVLLYRGSLVPEQMTRRYRARVSGPMSGEGVIALRIARDPRDERKRRTLPENDPSGQPARTRWKALSPTELELELETGRTHQIRVHLQAIGQPIIGDPLYGGAPGERLMLWSHQLVLPHPRDGQTMTFTLTAE